MSGPDTWVTVYTEDIGNTFGPKGVGAVPWPEVNTAGDYFLIAFDGPGRAIRCGMSISRHVRSLGIDTVSRPSSRNSWSEGARVDENSRLNWIRTPPGAAQECAGIRDLADRAVT
jgi:hypothetical protein